MAEVWIRRRRWRVVEQRRGTGLTSVRVAARDTGQFRTFLSPCEAIVATPRARVVRVRLRQALARLAGHVAGSSVAFAPGPLHRLDLSVLPFQLEPALALLAGRRRLLIADDVGMGKTVQAGLLLQATLAAGPDVRALVIAPASLLRQWTDELQTRFDLTPRIADTLALARLRATLPYLTSPWLLPGVWLTSPDFLKQPHVLEGLPPVPWDLLIIDEAHQLSGLSQRHDAIHALAVTAHRVVLLTATPHDGDDSRFRRLLAVGSRGDGLTVFRRTRAADSTRRIVRWLPVRLADDDVRVLNAIDAFERTARSTQTARVNAAHDGLPLICSVLRRRALSSPDALRASLVRRLAIIAGTDDDGTTGSRDHEWQQPGLFDSDVFGADEAEALSADSGLPVARERAWLQRLQHLCARHTTGGRARALACLLRRCRDRAVIFTQYRDSLPSVVAALPPGRRAAVMHGGQTPAEQHRALTDFLDRRADTLVATDVASQGLNLHTTARWAICFDVPWTPLRLEQRIGRVDRIGQTRRVHGTILTSRHPFDRTIRERLASRAHQSTHTRLATCTRWTRAAARYAAWCGAQRRLAAHWRHLPADDACVTRVSSAFVRRWLGRDARGVAAYELPFVTESGVVLERRVVVVDVDMPVAALVAQAARRARILTCRLRVRAALRARTHPQPLAPVQPGLFGTRPGDGGAAGAPANELGGDFERNHLRAHLVAVGTPRLLVRFTTRPRA